MLYIHGAAMWSRIPSHYKSSFQRAGTAYVVFTSTVEFSTEVLFAPSSRSGGRRGTPFTVIIPPGGRAFKPFAISPRLWSNRVNVYLPDRSSSSCRFPQRDRRLTTAGGLKVALPPVPYGVWIQKLKRVSSAVRIWRQFNVIDVAAVIAT